MLEAIQLDKPILNPVMANRKIKRKYLESF
jgi:hypothetical protein